MCADVDYFPHLLMNNNLLVVPTQYDRRHSSSNSILSTSSSSSSTATTTSSSSWFEKKLFSHVKRFFRRKSLSLTSNSSASSRRPSSTIEEPLELSIDEQQKQEEEENLIEKNVIINNNNESSSLTTPIANSIDLLYDYNHLLSRCIERQERDRTEMILRCQTPVSIPHADLILSSSYTILNNWKAYVRLFRQLNRDSYLFQQYINQYYSCRTSINQREQLVLDCRTNKLTFDNLLRKFLDDYVTCLICQTAQTYLIKSNGIWRIECQLCGNQRIVKRLKWKCYHHHHQE